MTFLGGGLPAALLTVLALGPLDCLAFDADADDYVAAPEGTRLGLVYFQHVERHAREQDSTAVAGNAALDSDTAILRYVPYYEVDGVLLAPQFLLPFGVQRVSQPGSAPTRTGAVGDLVLCLTVWPLVDAQAANTLGFTAYVSAPTGSYDRNRTINWGENRWQTTLQGGYQKGLTERLNVVGMADATVFGANPQAGPQGATLRQAVLYQAQFYLRYTFSARVDSFAGISETWGGMTRMDGVAQNDTVRERKFSLGGGYYFTPDLEVLATYGRDLAVSNGFRETRRINLRLTQSF